MKEWVFEQKREKFLRDQQEREEQKQYDDETKAINRMRGMLEDEMNDKRKNMMKAIQEENQRLALEKKMREERDKEWNQTKDFQEIS